VNPLAFLEADEPWASVRKVEVSPDHVLKFLCTPGSSNAVADLVERYKRVSVENPRLFAAPAEERVLERLIWPLRQAKGELHACKLLEDHFLMRNGGGDGGDSIFRSRKDPAQPSAT
jgi:hypothetical protein